MNNVVRTGGFPTNCGNGVMSNECMTSHPIGLVPIAVDPDPSAPSVPAAAAADLPVTGAEIARIAGLAAMAVLAGAVIVFGIRRFAKQH